MFDVFDRYDYLAGLLLDLMIDLVEVIYLTRL